MEGGVRRGKGNKKGPLCRILLLMYIQVVMSEEPGCPKGDYLAENGICCNKCFPGFKLLEDCKAPGQRTNCTPCPVGQYTDKINYSPNCRSCKRCKKHDRVVSQCTAHQNTICRCEDGYYKFDIDSETYECRQCSPCRANEKETQACTPEKNTVCECDQNFYRFNNKCKPCKNCTADCGHYCSLNTQAPGPGQEYVFSIIVAAVAVVLSVLLIVTTYVLTKWCTKNELLNSSSQSSDDSSEPCEQVLIHSEDPLNNISIQAAPVSEYEQASNLPDCVPLEIKISDLIYMVLDLVPVLQVKQLVRSLGVKDTEIEQLELDHRSCREAHYQMMRVWAERGSRAGGMLHLPLLKELLDELRKMHLGQAAEELKMNYGFQ